MVERAVAVWAATLLVLVVVDKALRGRLPDEISGRGVRYIAEDRVDGVAGANRDLADRVGALEAGLEAFERRQEHS